MKDFDIVFYIQLFLVAFVVWPFFIGCIDIFWYAITEHQLTSLNWDNPILLIWLAFGTVVGVTASLG